MKPWTLKQWIPLFFLALVSSTAVAEEPFRITLLEPEAGTVTHRPELVVTVRIDAAQRAAEGTRQQPLWNRLDLYLDEDLIATREPLHPEGTWFFSIDLRPRRPGRALLTAVAWPTAREGESIEAVTEIEIRRHLPHKGLGHPEDDDDWDGLTNGDEVLIHGTDPNRPDTDNDGFWDGAELEPEILSDPLAATSIPALTVPAPTQAAVSRPGAVDLSTLDLGTAIAKPPTTVFRHETLGPPTAANVFVSRPPAAVTRREPIDTTPVTINTHLARPPVRVEFPDALAFLVIPERVPAATGESVSVPIELIADQASVASLAFSLDFDSDCLDFDGSDGDGDGLPDAIEFHVPAGFSTTVFVDPDDPDGELDVFLFSQPVTALPSGLLARVTFQVTCAPPTGAPLEVPVAFSFDPRATFGDIEGQDIPGTASAGSVEIFGGLRGDCNASTAVTAADLAALVLEIFDGDGDFWLDTPAGTFAGDPVGCDANADVTVAAADLSCTGRLLFDLGCGSEQGLSDVRPLLILTGFRLLDSGNVLAEIHLAGGQDAVTSLALSLDVDLDRFAFDPTDANDDGIPDAVRFLAPANLRSATFDADDKDGEIDIVLSDVGAEPRPFADGILLEIELQPLSSASAGLTFSNDPAASFGTALGQSLDGETVVVIGSVFADGFESGDVDLWSRVSP